MLRAGCVRFICNYLSRPFVQKKGIGTPLQAGGTVDNNKMNHSCFYFYVLLKWIRIKIAQFFPITV